MISRLIAACALALGLLTFATTAQAAPPDFTWSSSVSTTQAGGHPNVTFNYASSSKQVLTSIYVDYPQGMMHRNKLSGACSNPLYVTDSCPSSSTVGTVSAQIVVANAPITVPGTIYQLSEPSGGSDATFGIVLRPPLSSLGLTGKIFVRNQISFTNGGGLRSSLVGPLSSVSALGATLPSRIAQLKLTYNSQTPTGGIALISNPTSCKSQPFTVRGTFSDQSIVSRSSSFTTTNCPAVPFAPTGDIQLDNNTAGQKSGSLVITANPGGGSVASLHPGHVVAIGHDFDEVGDFDLAEIDAGPLCTDAQAASTSGCPADTQIGELSADIEGFGTVKGNTFATFSPGHKTISEITLRQGVTVRFPGVIGGDNKSTLSFSGMPQLPFTAFRFKSTRGGIWITNTCTIRSVHMIGDSYASGHADRQIQLPKPTCPPPAAPTITDGPDRGITINTSHVEYRFPGKEVDTAWECAKDDGPYAACSSPFVDDFQGEGVHTFSVRGVRGGLTGPATTATFSIDTLPPELALDVVEYRDSDHNGIADEPFRDPDFAVEFKARDMASGLATGKLGCTLDNPATGITVKPIRLELKRESSDIFICTFAGVPTGPEQLTLTAYDVAGHVTVLKLGLIIVSGQPAITVNEKKTMFTDAPTAEVPIEISDESLRYDQGEVTVECARKGWDGTIKGSAKIITDRDSGRSKGFCVFPDVPEGSFKVEVRGWNPVKKESVAEGDLVVDRSPPELTLTNPDDADSDGDGVADKRFRPSFFDVFTEVSDLGSGIDPDGSSCRAKGIVTTKPSGGTGKAMICSFAGLPEGDVEVEITARNYVGTVTIVKRGFTVDTLPPEMKFVDAGDLDSDGDGFADRRFRPSFFDVFTEVSDLGSGVDPNSGECLVKPRKGGVITGSIVVNNGNLRCSFEGLPDGDADVEISVADHRGHVTVLKSAVTVDSSPPAITFTDFRDDDSDGDGFANERFRPSFFDVFTEITDLESGIDPNGTSCVAKVVNKGVVKGAINVVNGNRVSCSLADLPDGDVEVELTARNYVGTVTIVKRGFTVDTTPPTMSFTDAGDLDADGDGFSDNRVRAARLGYEILVDDKGSGIDPNSGACLAKPRKGGVITGSIIVVSSNLRCSFEGLPDGDTDIEISIADYRGHVTVLKAAVTIESPPPPATPVLTILSPATGQSITQGSSLNVVFSITGTGPFTFRCAIDNIVVLASCQSGSLISTSGMSTGTHVLKIVGYDGVGSNEATRAFNIVPPGGGTVCVAIYPPPAGCPGYIPPAGGGGVITLP